MAEAKCLAREPRPRASWTARLSDGGALSYGEAVCSESGLACDGTVLSGGDVFDCDTPLVAGTVLFALCR
jgi:hypothetical protein